MERIKVSTLAKSLQTSTTTIYKHLKRLEDRLSGQVKKDGGVTYLTPTAVNLVTASIQAVTVQPEPVEETRAIVQTSAQVDFSPVSGRLALIEKAILAQIDQGNAILKENRQLREENAALFARLREQSEQLTALQASVKALPAPALEKPAERSFSDELAAAVKEIRDTITGAVAPFTAWLKLG
mgnify:CR=1 FL=1